MSRLLLLALLAAPAAYLLYVGLPTLVGYLLRARFLVRLRRVPRGVYLTFDDGPSPLRTPELLRELERHGRQGLFFIVGRNAEAHPQIVAAAAAGGHRIGEHTWGHRHPWKTGPLAAIRDLRRSSAVMRRFCAGQRRIPFRPPYGKLNLPILLYVLFMRRTLVYWNVDPKDYRAKDARTVVERLRPRLNGGAAVVLLHDGSPGPAGSAGAARGGPAAAVRELLAQGLAAGDVSLL
jgi:peptidoglycan/xylan/chitin deacetylase (PgdA/CDA1 family)